MKIYLYCVDGGMREGDVIGYALGEDGHGLASHLSSDEGWSKHDMGLTSNWKHDHYAEVYPGGYELEWVDNHDLDNHEGFKKALELNHKAKTEEGLDVS